MGQINLRGARVVQQFQTNRIFRRQKNLLVKLYVGDNKKPRHPVKIWSVKLILINWSFFKNANVISA